MLKTSQPLVILASARYPSDTRRGVESLLKDTNHQVIDLLHLPIIPYNYNGDYPESDCFQDVVEAMLRHDQLIFATPVYWYAMSGLMKTLFDRFTDLVTIQKSAGRHLKGKKVFLLAVGADDELPEGFEVPFYKSADYLDMEYKGSVYIQKNLMDTDAPMDALRKDFLTLLGN